MIEPVSNPALPAAMEAADSLCIKCGFCLPVCPTYRETGSEAASPRGRLELMYATARGELDLEDIREPLELCLGCLACETACPSGIRFGDLLEAGRADAARGQPAGPFKRLLMDRVLLSPSLLRAAAWGLFCYQKSGLQALLRVLNVLWLFPALARLEGSLPPIGPPLGWRRGARGCTATSLEAAGEGKSAVLFTGCVMDTLFGEVHAATAKVLARHGYTALLPPGQGCCGALHAHEGDESKARQLARSNIAACEAAGEAPIVVNSAGCGSMLKAYGELLADDAQWAGRARRMADRVQDVNQFLADLPPLQALREVPIQVAYDDACHLLHAQGIGDAPRRLLAAIPGLELVPLPEADWCCGAAGSYSLHQPAMAGRVLARKMGHIAATAVPIVATANPGCMLQIRLGAKRHRLQLHVVHPVQLLARACE